MAEEALERMCRRAVSRTAFGKPLAKLGGNYDKIANARMAIDMARLLTLRAAHAIDTQGVQEAQLWISKIKAHVPNVALDVMEHRRSKARCAVVGGKPLGNRATHVDHIDTCQFERASDARGAAQLHAL